MSSNHAQNIKISTKMHVATCKAHGRKTLLQMHDILLPLLEAKAVSTDENLDLGFIRQIQENSNKLGTIISTIPFCGMHDLALRGKESNSGNFYDLLEFRVESGDEVLGNHLSIGSCSAKYISATTQNTIIEICGSLLREDIVREANNSVAFSILADETNDI